MFSVQCSVFGVQCIVYTVKWVVQCSVRCAVCNIQFAVYSVYLAEVCRGGQTGAPSYMAHQNLGSPQPRFFVSQDEANGLLE